MRSRPSLVVQWLRIHLPDIENGLVDTVGEGKSGGRQIERIA